MSWALYSPSIFILVAEEGVSELDQPNQSLKGTMIYVFAVDGGWGGESQNS